MMGYADSGHKTAGIHMRHWSQPTFRSKRCGEVSSSKLENFSFGFWNASEFCRHFFWTYCYFFVLLNGSIPSRFSFLEASTRVPSFSSIQIAMNAWLLWMWIRGRQRKWLSRVWRRNFKPGFKDRGEGRVWGGRMDQWGKVGRTWPKRETFLGEMTESWKLFRSLFTEIAAR